MNNKHIEECFNAEVLMSGKKFSWLKLLRRAIKCPVKKILFLAQGVPIGVLP